MSIKTKVAFVYSLFIFSLILLTLFMSQSFIKDTVSNIEENYIVEDLKKLKGYLDSEKENLLSLAKDWSAWTDAWLYMQGKNPKFIESNLTVESFINNKITLLAYFDLKGKLKNGAEYEQSSKNLLPVDKKFWGKYIERFLATTDRTSLKLPSFVGLSFKNNKPILVAVCPVLKSDFSAPVTGYLIMSRQISEEKLNFIREFFGFRSLKIDKIKEIEDNLSNNPLIKRESGKYEGFYIIKDFFGNYNILLNIEKDKKLWNIVKGNILKVSIFYLSCFLIFGAVFYLWMRSQIVNKITEIVKDLDNVKERKAEEVKISGKDEIGYLAQEINTYIDTVKKQIVQIEESRKIYETIAEQSEAIIFLFDHKGETLFINSKAKEILKNKEEKSFAEHLFHLLKEVLYMNKEERTFLSEFKLQEDLFVSGWIIPVGEIEKRLLFIAYDITPLKKEKEKLLHKASRDELTSLYNRSYFEFYFRKIVNNVQMGEVYSLIFIDLDNLKKINDRFGHVFGDEVIKETAKAIHKSIREEDLAARWGGDEFIIIIKGNTDVAKTISERIQTNLQKTVLDSKGEKITPTVSIGITRIDAFEESEIIIRQADKAAYDAKREGKNKIKIFNPTE